MRDIFSAQRAFEVEEHIVAPIPARAGYLIVFSKYRSGGAFMTSHGIGERKIIREYRIPVGGDVEVEALLNRLCWSDALTELRLPADEGAPEVEAKPPKKRTRRAKVANQ